MIDCLDHLVLTVYSLERTCEFYQRVLGLERIDTPDKPTALKFGTQKLNIHEVGKTFEPKAMLQTPGSADFCLITTKDIDEVKAHLIAHSVVIELGPVPRVGARGPMTSLYFRDPDLNLIEVSRYD